MNDSKTTGLSILAIVVAILCVPFAIWLEREIKARDEARLIINIRNKPAIRDLIGRWAFESQTCDYAITLKYSESSLFAYAPDDTLYKIYDIANVRDNVVSTSTDGEDLLFEINGQAMTLTTEQGSSRFTRC